MLGGTCQVPNVVRLLIVTLLAALAVSAQVRVRGHFRRDGTYVQPHYRSYPDGNFYNNWSTKGNVNPYTGAPGTRVTPPSSSGSGYGALLDYYRSIRPTQPGRIDPSRNPPSAKTPWTEPSGLSRLPALPEALPDDELSRSDRYCMWLYDRDDLSLTNCRVQQVRVLATIVLPDYSAFPQSEVARGAGYCEWLYGDNRASFYDCFNRQIVGLAKPEATFPPQIPTSESTRSQRYCEWLYGNNRASYRDCIENQSRQLGAIWPVEASDIPADEWQRSRRYCEWLYENNRGSAAQCLSEQARTLRQHLRQGTFQRAAGERARSYCEWLYSNNRANYWNCIASR